MPASRVYCNSYHQPCVPACLRWLGPGMLTARHFPFTMAAGSSQQQGRQELHRIPPLPPSPCRPSTL